MFDNYIEHKFDGKARKIAYFQPWPELKITPNDIESGQHLRYNFVARKPNRKGLAAIYRQEIIRDIALFTSQGAASFYDKLFASLDFELPRAKTGRTGFPKEAMLCAVIVMKCEG